MKTYRNLAWASVALMLLCALLPCLGLVLDAEVVLVGAGLAFAGWTLLFVVQVAGLRRLLRERGAQGVDRVLAGYLWLNIALLVLLALGGLAMALLPAWGKLILLVVGAMVLMAVGIAVGVMGIIVGVRIRKLPDTLWGLREPLGWSLLLNGVFIATYFASYFALVLTAALTLLMAMAIHRQAGGDDRPFGTRALVGVFVASTLLCIIPLVALVLTPGGRSSSGWDDERYEALPAERPLPGVEFSFSAVGDRLGAVVYDALPNSDRLRLDTPEGFLAQDRCTLKRSLDGGRTWSPVGGAGACIRAGAAADGRVFVIDEQGSVQVSADLGRSWRQLLAPAQPLATRLGVSTDGNRLFVFDDEGGVRFSSDGGANWRSADIGLVADGGAFHCADSCWLTQGTTLHRVSIGASGVETTRLADLAELLPPTEDDEPDWPELLWFDAAGRHGLVASSAGQVLRTSDGGASWTRDPPRDFYLWSLIRAGGDHWLLGQRGVIQRLKQDGPWETVTIPANAYAQDICVLPERSLIALTLQRPDGHVYSEDGGTTWHASATSLAPCYAGPELMVTPAGHYRLTAP